jgi:hypothetical protein
MPTADADAIHSDLVSEVAPQCDRHWSESPDPTHTIDGVDYYRVDWPVRPQVAQALLDLVDAGSYPDLSVTPSTTPYADITYPPLPAEGETCEAQQIYDAGDRFVMCRQTHPRGINPVEDVPALFALYREGGDLTWSDAGEMLHVGDVRTYQGDDYVVRQAHQALPGREPDVYTAGWWRMKPVGDGGAVPEWQDQTDYEVGDRVTYQGTEYECLQAHTSQVGWEPPNVPALWSEV